MLEFSNLIFSFLFAVEMLLKIVADGPFGYIRDGFNVFDGFIVVLRSRFLIRSSSFVAVFLDKAAVIRYNKILLVEYSRCSL